MRGFDGEFMVAAQGQSPRDYGTSQCRKPGPSDAVTHSLFLPCSVKRTLEFARDHTVECEIMVDQSKPLWFTCRLKQRNGSFRMGDTLPGATAFEGDERQDMQRLADGLRIPGALTLAESSFAGNLALSKFAKVEAGQSNAEMILGRQQRIDHLLDLIRMGPKNFPDFALAAKHGEHESLAQG